MAIINKFFIRRFREVIVDVQPGLFEDGGASTFQLDDPAGGNFGTSDFLSTVKRVVLLGEIVKNVVDTNPRNLRPDPIPYGRFFQLTDDDYRNAINTGDIVINPRTRGTEEVIGWVELGKSFPSLYYQDCIIGNSSGKQPRVDNYFDLNELELSVFTVSGQGNGGGALQRTGTWNINESMGNWGTIPYPSQQFVPFDEYMRAVVFNNGNIGQDSFTTLAERGLNQIPLLIADRVENFESNSTTVLTPSFSNPVVSGQSAEKTVYARNRRFILDGFKPGTIEFRSLTATCIPIATVAPPPPPPPSVVDEGEAGEEDIIEGYISENDPPETELETIDSEYEYVDLGPIDPTELKPCGRNSTMPIRVFYRGEYVGSGSAPIQYGTAAGIQDGSLVNNGVSENDVYPIQILYDVVSEDAGIKDPRELSGNSSLFPNGIFKAVANTNECYTEVSENYRDKDGDHPEYVGPVVVNYQENVRRNMMNQFFTDSPLLSLGVGTDGYEYFSDGNSYLELHGESVFGCGEKFSIADIPEIFNDMYPQEINRNGVVVFGKKESEDVKFYRRNFERMTNLTQGIIDVLENWLGEDAIPARLKDDKLTLNDLFNDFTIGVPDLDFALVGTDIIEKLIIESIERALKDAISTAVPIVGPDIAKFLFDSRDSEVPPNPEDIVLLRPGVVSNKPYTLKDFILDEERPYSDPLLPSKPKPRSYSRYRSFNSFWSREGLRNVYGETSSSKFIEKSQSIYDNIVWKNDFSPIGEKIRSLREKQARYSYPSRWKAMMRPIYSELWYNKEQIKPQNVSTRRYFGENLLELELGDYESHRKLFGMQKNLYDDIDDAISIRLHDDIFDSELSEDLQQFSSFGLTTNGIRFRLRSLFDQTLQGAIPFTLQQYDVDFGRLVNQVSEFDTSKLGSYLDLVNNVVNFYRDLANIYQQLFPNQAFTVENVLNNLNEFGKSISQSIESFTANPGETVEGIAKQVGKYLVDVGSQILNNIAIEFLESVLTYIVNSFLLFFNQELNRTNPERSSFSPRRVFKKGSVYLRSQSGLYYTNKQPCPIIFLGFNDGGVMSSFSEFNNQLQCLGSLTKEDLISTVRYVNPKYNPFLLDSYSSGNPILQEINPNLGMVSSQMEKFKEDFNFIAQTQIRQDTIPTINKRPRQYGKNPLLDIFYLNLIPEAFANNPTNTINTKTAPYTHRTSTPMPYRIPNQNDWVGNRVFAKDFSKPSYFPPHWNEPQIREGTPGVNYKDLSMYHHGDLLFMNRQPSTILEAKDRWSMSLDALGDENVIILTDKTRILDIYFGLMQLHVHGVSWDEIVTYINEAKSAIKIGTDIDFFTHQKITVASHLKSSIDTNKLEKLWQKIEARLNYNNPLHISSDGFWRNVQPISAIDKPTEFDEFFISAGSVNNPKYRKKIGLFNNTDKEMVIKEMSIINESADDLDIYGKDGASMFFVGDSLTVNISTQGTLDFIQSKTSISLPPYDAKTSETNYTNVWFIPYGAQPGKRYSARLQIIVDIEGEEYVFSQLLAAESENPSIIRNWSSSLLSLPVAVSWGRISNIFSFEDDGIEVELRNLARENILVESFNIISEKLFDQNGKDITNTLTTTPDFFTFETKDNTDNSIKSIDWNKALTIPLINLRPTSNEAGGFQNGPRVYVNRNKIIANNSYKENCIYIGTCEVTYSLAPRISETDRVIKTTTFDLNFSTII